MIKPLAIFETAEVVTKSDTATNSFLTLRSPSAGNIKVTTSKGDDIVIPCLEGEKIQMAVKKVWSTGTTVTGNIIGYK